MFSQKIESHMQNGSKIEVNIMDYLTGQCVETLVDIISGDSIHARKGDVLVVDGESGSKTFPIAVCRFHDKHYKFAVSEHEIKAR